MTEKFTRKSPLDNTWLTPENVEVALRATDSRRLPIDIGTVLRGVHAGIPEQVITSLVGPGKLPDAVKAAEEHVRKLEK